MRCPKCSYLSYEEVARCRNCGYDFSLAVPPETVEAPTLDSPGEPRAWRGPTSRASRGPTDLMAPVEEGSAVDLPLFEAPAPTPPPAPPPPLAVPAAPRPSAAPPRMAPGVPADAPLVIPPAPPPLVVRRTVDTRPAPGGTSRGGRPRDTGPALDFDDPPLHDADDLPGPADAAGWTDQDGLDTSPLLDADTPVDTGAPRSTQRARLTAGLIDAAILVGIDAVVVWLTLRMLGLPLEAWARLPLAPLLGFLFLLDTSYLVTFTAASGQTIGKMVSGVRVVSNTGSRVPFGHAVVRSAVLLLCAAPAGLGLVPIVFDPRARGLHDRVAGTRVVDAR